MQNSVLDFTSDNGIYVNSQVATARKSRNGAEMLHFMQAIRKRLWERGTAVRRIPQKAAENTRRALAFFCYTVPVWVMLMGGLEMLTFSIYGVEVIGEDVRNLPIVSTEDKDNALEAFKAQIRDAFDTMNGEMMRGIGGKIDIYMGACDKALGIGADIIKQATVKRPQHSPQAEIWISLDGRPPMRRVDVGEL